MPTRRTTNATTMPAKKTTAQTTKKATAKAASPTNTMTNTKAPVTQSVGRVGNVGSMQELAYSNSGRAWLRFSLAVHPYDVEAKKASEEPVWYDCICFGYLAQHVDSCIKSGDRVVVCGRPQINEWTDDEGTIHKQKQIVCDGVGADLLFSTVAITKAFQSSSNSQNVIDFEDEEEPF